VASPPCLSERLVAAARGSLCFGGPRSGSAIARCCLSRRAAGCAPAGASDVAWANAFAKRENVTAPEPNQVREARSETRSASWITVAPGRPSADVAPPCPASCLSVCTKLSTETVPSALAGSA